MTVLKCEYIREAYAFYRMIGLGHGVYPVNDCHVAREVDGLLGGFHRKRLLLNGGEFRRPVHQFAVGGDVREFRLHAEDGCDGSTIAGNDGR